MHCLVTIRRKKGKKKGCPFRIKWGDLLPSSFWLCHFWGTSILTALPTHTRTWLFSSGLLFCVSINKMDSPSTLIRPLVTVLRSWGCIFVRVSLFPWCVQLFYRGMMSLNPSGTGLCSRPISIMSKIRNLDRTLYLKGGLKNSSCWYASSSWVWICIFPDKLETWSWYLNGIPKISFISFCLGQYSGNHCSP